MPILSQRCFPFGCNVNGRKKKNKNHWTDSSENINHLFTFRVDVSRLSAFDVTVSTNRVIHRVGEMETGKLLRSIRLIRVASIHLKPYTAAFPIKKPEISSINPLDFGINRRCSVRKRNDGLRNNKFRDRITIIALCIRVAELSLIAMHLYFALYCAIRNHKG